VKDLTLARMNSLRSRIKMLEASRQRIAALVGKGTHTEDVVWLDEMRTRLRGELSLARRLLVKTFAKGEAWGLLYAMYETARPASCSPENFREGLSVDERSLRRYRKSAEKLAPVVRGMSRAELVALWLRLATSLGLNPEERTLLRRKVLRRQARQV
jgi:hypothetical protein